MTEQFLDSMDLERERGITIKQHSVRLDVQGEGRPGLRPEPDRHARPRRLLLRGLARRWPPARARCWWSTPARASRRRRSRTRYLASDAELEIIPVLNKIDLPGAEPERVARADRAGDRHRRLGRHARPRPSRASASTRSWRRSSSGSRRPRATPTARCAASSSTPGSTSTAASWCCVHVVDGRLEPGMKVRLMASGERLRGGAARRLHAEAAAGRRARGRARSAS